MSALSSFQVSPDTPFNMQINSGHCEGQRACGMGGVGLGELDHGADTIIQDRPGEEMPQRGKVEILFIKHFLLPNLRISHGG